MAVRLEQTGRGTRGVGNWHRKTANPTSMAGGDLKASKTGEINTSSVDYQPTDLCTCRREWRDGTTDRYEILMKPKEKIKLWQDRLDCWNHRKLCVSFISPPIPIHEVIAADIKINRPNKANGTNKTIKPIKQNGKAKSETQQKESTEPKEKELSPAVVWYWEIFWQRIPRYSSYRIYVVGINPSVCTGSWCTQETRGRTTLS